MVHRKLSPLALTAAVALTTVACRNKDSGPDFKKAARSYEGVYLITAWTANDKGCKAEISP